jgi:hypothetical protein
MEGVEMMMAKGRDDMCKVRTVLANDKDMPASGKEVLGGLTSAFENMAGVVEMLASIVIDVANRNRSGNGNGNGKGNNGRTPNYAAAAGGSGGQAKHQVSQEEVRKKKFVQAVKEAEKSVLVFGLDLGKVQIMNTSTLSRNVTQDIVSKAAKKERKKDGRPSDETVAVLDDTLSMVTGMDFFGKVTKPFQNKRDVNDVRNGKFCTMPVKLNFKSKEAKGRADNVLRWNCGISGSTPYPMKLRKLIGKTIAEEKEKNPSCFIQVKVDTDSLTLKLSKRNDKKEWHNNYASVPIPTEVMDLSTVSNSFTMETDSSQASL